MIKETATTSTKELWNTASHPSRKKRSQWFLPRHTSKAWREIMADKLLWKGCTFIKKINIKVYIIIQLWKYRNNSKACMCTNYSPSTGPSFARASPSTNTSHRPDTFMAAARTRLQPLANVVRIYNDLLSKNTGCLWHADTAVLSLPPIPTNPCSNPPGTEHPDRPVTWCAARCCRAEHPRRAAVRWSRTVNPTDEEYQRPWPAYP